MAPIWPPPELEIFIAPFIIADCSSPFLFCPKDGIEMLFVVLPRSVKRLTLLVLKVDRLNSVLSSFIGDLSR